MKFFNKKTKKQKQIMGMIFGVLVFFTAIITTKVLAAPEEEGLVYGDVAGWAWMGTGIVNDTVSEGGGGWVSFNCEPSDCANGDWGVQMQVSHGLDPDSDGQFVGQAWSSNYGWLSFDEDIVSSCWTTNPLVVTQHPAKAMLGIAPDSNGTIPIRGWAKFIAGDDFPNDGWDGCVSFDGPNYAVKLDLDDGILRGWAWGGPVAGWLSFANRECRYCNTSVYLPGNVDISFWANNTTVPPGGSTVLNWEAADDLPLNFVDECTYSNTSNYSHWRSGLGTPAEISVSAGNLPAGTHPISGINQTTTYQLNCTDQTGASLPTKYVTVTVAQVIAGCMDSTASNYDPAATLSVPSSCVYNTTGPTVSLSMVTNFLPNFVPVGSSVPFDYQVSPRWTFTNPTLVGTPYCHGQFFDEDNVEQTLVGWTGADLARPFAPMWNAGPYATTNNTASFAPGAQVGDVFTYKINCTDNNGNVFSDTAVVEFIPNAATEPTLDLSASPGSLVVGSGSYSTGLTWVSDQPSEFTSCVGSLDAGTATNWDGTRSVPNITTPYSVNLAPYASSASAGDTFTFTLTCTKSGGGTVSDTATVIMTDGGTGGCPPDCPNTEVAVLDLKITSPNVTPGFDTEILPSIGNPNVTMTWANADMLNIDYLSCVGSSIRYVNGTIPEPSAEWNSQDFSGPGQANLNMSVPGNGGHPTEYTLTCDGLDGNSYSDTVYVAITGVTTPWPISGSGLPTYEER